MRGDWLPPCSSLDQACLGVQNPKKLPIPVTGYSALASPAAFVRPASLSPKPLKKGYLFLPT